MYALKLAKSAAALAIFAHAVITPLSAYAHVDDPNLEYRAAAADIIQKTWKGSAPPTKQKIRLKGGYAILSTKESEETKNYCRSYDIFRRGVPVGSVRFCTNAFAPANRKPILEIPSPPPPLLHQQTDPRLPGPRAN